MENMLNYRAVLFVSRNKDNKDVDNFVQRTRTFLTTKEPNDLMCRFAEFCNGGVVGEYSRFYISVNEFDHDKVRTRLQAHLLYHPETDLSKLESKLVALAQENKNSYSCNATKRFLLDYDSTEGIEEFVEDVKRMVDNTNVIVQTTPNGYAVVTEHGFDTRELLEKYSFVSLHRQGQLFITGGYTDGSKSFTL